MKAIDFEQSNKNLAKPVGTTDEECGSLHVYSDGKYCLSLWKGDWKDRLRYLFTGRMWLWVWFGHTQPPVMMQTNHPWENTEKNDGKETELAHEA